jgi:hypothetical protein
MKVHAIESLSILKGSAYRYIRILPAGRSWSR